MHDRALLTIVLPLGALVTAASCTFINVDVDGAGGGVSTTASGTNGSTAASTANASTASIASSTAEATATTGMAGSVAATTSSGMTCADCIESTNCNCDHDGYERYDPDHGCLGQDGQEQGSDCNDCNDLVHPGQGNWYTIGVDGGTGFDYNCDTLVTYQYHTHECEKALGGALGCATGTSNDTAELTCGGAVTTQECGSDNCVLSCCPQGAVSTVVNGNGCH